MTKEIELTQGKKALVDDEDYEELNQWMWCAGKPDGRKNSKHYARRKVKSGGKTTTMFMHRQILGLVYGDGKVCDHINRNPLDNRRANLRVASYTINSRNCDLRSDNTSGYMGVSLDKARDKWIAQIRVDSTMIHLGGFTNIEDAVEARRHGEERLW